MKFEDKSGAGVNITVRAAIPSLIWRACHPDEIFERIQGAIKQMVKRDGLQWDMVAEEKQTNDRIISAYHNMFEREYDPSTGVIPIWLPMEFHETWAAALAAGKRPTMSRNGSGWHVRSYTPKENNGDEPDSGTEKQSADEKTKQDSGPKAPFVLPSFKSFDPAALPPREFLFGKHY